MDELAQYLARKSPPDVAPPPKNRIKLEPRAAEDPSDYLARKLGTTPVAPASEETSEEKKPGTVESVGRGLLQGVTLGFSDELTGLVESAFSSKSYEQARDESRAANQAAKDENPWAYGISEVVGGVGSAAATGGAGIAARAGLTGTKAAMAVSGTMGAASGAGHAEGDALDTAKRAALGGVGGALTAGALGSSVSKAAAGGSGKGFDMATLGLAVTGNTPMAAATYGAKKATEALASLARAAQQASVKQGSFGFAKDASAGLKARALDAIQAGVPVGTVQGVLSNMPEMPVWLDELGKSNE